MTDEALRLAFNKVCDERDRSQRRVRDLETLTMDLRVRNQQLEFRLRIADLMEQEAQRRAVTVDEFSVLAGEVPREIVQ